MTVRNSLITPEIILDFLHHRLSQTPSGNDHDFHPLLVEGSATFKVSMDFLLKKGFRKAYRQIVEGL
jgi:hypothetical protein